MFDLMFQHDFHKLQSVASTLSWFSVVILRGVKPNIAKLFPDEYPSESYLHSELGVLIVGVSNLIMVFGATFEVRFQYCLCPYDSSVRNTKQWW